MVDVSGFAVVAPVFAFFLVFVVVFGVLFKTGVLGENKWVQLFSSFLVASIFISLTGARDLVLTVVPWVVVLILSLFFILLIIGWIGKGAEFLHKPIGIVVVILLGLIFLVSAFVVFSDVLSGYLPGPGFGSGDSEPEVLFFLSWLYSPRVLGGILLIGLSAIVSWVLVKMK
jgi:hypothetical protein